LLRPAITARAGEIPRVTTETFARMVSVLTGGLKPGAGPTRDKREKGFYASCHERYLNAR
jgi:hypothetical protein